MTPNQDPCPAVESSSIDPDWVQASPARIGQALRHALAKPGGNWFVVDASRRVREAPRRYVVAGTELVVWRDEQGIAAAPASCPHMGADLSTGRVCAKGLVCPWHGLVLGRQGHGAWQPFPTHDDGTLLWARLPVGELSRPTPPASGRPERYVAASFRFELSCDPQDVLANRLDPWHGAHLHGHSFEALEVTSAERDALRMWVRVKAFGPIRADAEVVFSCPSPRSIVMTIERGEGAGSVLETHATPIAPGRTAVTEAIFATTSRPATMWLLERSWVRPVLRRQMIAHAKKLWNEDRQYSERRYALRNAAP